MSVIAPTPVTHAPVPPVTLLVRVRNGGGFWLLIALLALVGAGKAIQADTMDPDAFWHLRVADQLMSDGVGPLVDRISFASLKTPWTPYSWLAELFMRAVWSTGGFRLATIVTAACSAAIVVLIAAAARTALSINNESNEFGDGEAANNDVAAALLTAVAAFFTLPFLSFRPVTFALVVMAAIVWLLVRDRRRATKCVWAIVPLTVLLTNLHLYAVVVVALAWVTWIASRVSAIDPGATGRGTPRPVLGLRGRHRSRRTATCGTHSNFPSSLLLPVAVSLAACCTPMLRGVFTTAMNYNAVDPMVAANYITEMRPFYTGGTGKVSLGLFVLMIGVCVLRWRRLDIVDWLWLALGTALLFRLGRFRRCSRCWRHRGSRGRCRRSAGKHWGGRSCGWRWSSC